MENLITYEQVIKHFGSPTKAAKALGFYRDKSSLRIKTNGVARVAMWKYLKNGIVPKKMQQRVIVAMAVAENRIQDAVVALLEPQK